MRRALPVVAFPFAMSATATVVIVVTAAPFFEVPGDCGVTAPAGSLGIRRTTVEVIDAGIETEVKRNVRPAHAAPAQVDNDRWCDARALRDVEHDWNFVGRACCWTTTTSRSGTW